MKKRALAILMAALTASTMFAVPTFAADYSGEDPQLEKNIKILTIWAEDNDNGMLLNKICEDYQKNVNPNFTWEYEMVASDNLQQKIATLAASNDLPDLFAYEAGAPLSVLIDSGKVKNITEAVDEIGTADYLNSGAVELLKGLSGTDDLYDLPLGLNVEGFWYNKALFEQAGCEVPTTWDEFEEVLQKLSDAGVHIIIDMNHISTNDGKGATAFLGVTAQSITLKNAYGQLTYRDESYTPQEFSSENADWNTVYLNGLNRVDGTVRVGERILPYVGSVSAYENITFLAMNLPYHLQLTGDETVYTLLEQVFGTDRETIPKREIVPLEIARDRDSITIRTDYENTNTALAYYDIFQPDREIAVDWYLVSVGKGTTVIRLQYPYLKQGMIVSLVGMQCRYCKIS